MKKTLLILPILVTFLASCSDNRDSGYQPHPLSPEAQAQEKFYKSGISTKLRDIGINFSCRDFCTHVTPESLKMWERYFEQFAVLKGKIETIELTDRDQVSFFHPIGTYGLLLPMHAKESDLKEIFVTFDRLLFLEHQLGAKVFVSSTKPIFTEAINVLIDNVEDVIYLNLKEIYITMDATSYSNIIQIASLNVITLNSSVQTSLRRISLFFEAYEKIPNLDIEVHSNDDGTYQFLEDLIGRSSDIISSIGPYPFRFYIDSSEVDPYFSGKGFGYHMVSLSSKRSLQEAIGLLEYETYLIRLGENLDTRFRHYNSMASYSQYASCLTKIKNIETAIDSKREKIESVYINYDSMTVLESSFFKDKELFLRCTEDSVEEILQIIEKIE